MIEEIKALDSAIADDAKRRDEIQARIDLNTRKRDAMFGALSDDEKAQLQPATPAQS